MLTGYHMKLVIEGSEGRHWSMVGVGVPVGRIHLYAIFPGIQDCHLQTKRRSDDASETGFVFGFHPWTAQDASMLKAEVSAALV